MLATIAALLSTTIPNAPITIDGTRCHPRNLMVKYESPAALKSISKLGKVIKTIPQINFAVIETQPGQIRTARKQIARLNGIQKVELDRCALPAYNPNDQYWPDQWHMRAIKTDFAWDTLKGDPGVIVAVIDTGVNVTHPDLAANIWVNNDEIPGNGIDDDNNGYIDDVNGYDFAYNDADPDDVYGHGTPCAGLVVGIQDNTIGVSGVAPGCKVMALKSSIDEGYLYDSANVPAYIYAADNGAKVLSMSFYSDRVSQSERDAIDYCWNNGVVPVAAAGNAASVFPHYPGGYENVIAVAAIDSGLNKAGFSNYGTWVDVSAPGTGLFSTTANGQYTSGFGGTSGATPHVAGVAALCFSMNLGATNQQVRNAVEDTATIQTQAPYGEFSNYGLVNAQKAVLRMAGGPVEPHPPMLRYQTRYALTSVKPNSRKVARIYGRGFGPGNTVRIFAGDQTVGIIAKSRDWIDFYCWSRGPEFEVIVNGNSAGQFTVPATNTDSFLLTQASTQGATLEGGFHESSNVDNTAIRCTRRSDGYILVQANFRKVADTQNMRLVLRRQYTGTTTGNETVQLYDWSSGSYPYGNFVTVGSGACPTNMTTTNFNVANFSRFIDPEGTVYMLISTSNDLPEGTELKIDHARLDVQ